MVNANASAIVYACVEESEIWLPDFVPYNAYRSFGETMESVQARVGSDGDVFWSRPGTLDLLCRFSGFVAFPFDELSCAAEIGGWTLSDGSATPHNRCALHHG